jgi:hypothetical protein
MAVNPSGIFLSEMSNDVAMVPLHQYSVLVGEFDDYGRSIP